MNYVFEKNEVLDFIREGVRKAMQERDALGKYTFELEVEGNRGVINVLRVVVQQKDEGR